MASFAEAGRAEPPAAAPLDALPVGVLLGWLGGVDARRLGRVGGLAVAQECRVVDAERELLRERGGEHAGQVRGVLDELAAHAKGMLTRVDALMAPGLEAAVSDEYMSSHWVATFAWEALRLN